MSDTDGFIDEVNEELRRDQFARSLKRYGWIAVVLVLLIVGSAAFSEYRKSAARAQAQAFGDEILDALDSEDNAARATALEGITSQDPQASAVLALLTASEQIGADKRAGAIENLNAVALNGEVPLVYRQIAQFKALTLQAETMPVNERQQGFEALAGGSLRLLAEEQMALIAIDEGDTDAAIARYQALLTDAQVTPDLQQRALQVIVALGGEPNLDGTPELEGAQAPADQNNG